MDGYTDPEYRGDGGCGADRDRLGLDGYTDAYTYADVTAAADRDTDADSHLATCADYCADTYSHARRYDATHVDPVPDDGTGVSYAATVGSGQRRTHNAAAGYADERTQEPRFDRIA